MFARSCISGSSLFCCVISECFLVAFDRDRDFCFFDHQFTICNFKSDIQVVIFIAELFCSQTHRVSVCVRFSDFSSSAEADLLQIDQSVFRSGFIAFYSMFFAIISNSVFVTCDRDHDFDRFDLQFTICNFEFDIKVLVGVGKLVCT